jgi:hypothetical protein
VEYIVRDIVVRCISLFDLIGVVTKVWTPNNDESILERTFSYLNLEDPVSVLDIGAFDVVYKLCDASSVDRGMSVFDDFIAGSLSTDAKRVIDTSRLKALARKQVRSGGLQMPTTSSLPYNDRCGVPAMPSPPTNFLVECMPHVDADVLKHLHSHNRDAMLTFIASSHTYYINGEPSLGSVTGLVHKFADEFNADAVIMAMQNGRRWPRIGYLQHPPSILIIEALSKHLDASILIRMLSQEVFDQESIVKEMVRVCQVVPHLHELVRSLAMTSDQIKKMWHDNGVDAANRGTFMHLTFELYLNGAPINFYSVELDIFLRYLLTLERLVAYRTEWTIWATDERLAGSIDFVARKSNGHFVLFDWKRSKQLSTKYSNNWRNMKAPLEHLEDFSLECINTTIPSDVIT